MWRPTEILPSLVKEILTSTKGTLVEEYELVSDNFTPPAHSMDDIELLPLDSSPHMARPLNIVDFKNRRDELLLFYVEGSIGPFHFLIYGDCNAILPSTSRKKSRLLFCFRDTFARISTEAYRCHPTSDFKTPTLDIRLFKIRHPTCKNPTSDLLKSDIRLVKIRHPTSGLFKSNI